MNITKQMLEEILGYEILDFKVEPEMLSDNSPGFKIYIKPIVKAEHINVNFNITTKESEF
jgi:hypothetical protein